MARRPMSFYLTNVEDLPVMKDEKGGGKAAVSAKNRIDETERET